MTSGRGSRGARLGRSLRRRSGRSSRLRRAQRTGGGQRVDDGEEARWRGGSPARGGRSRVGGLRWLRGVGTTIAGDEAKGNGSVKGNRWPAGVGRGRQGERAARWGRRVVGVRVSRRHRERQRWRLRQGGYCSGEELTVNDIGKEESGARGSGSSV